MRIDFVQLQQFRNYDKAEIKFHPNVNILIGANGQGKSNLIEAIYLALNGSTFRPSDRTDLIKSGADSAKISAVINQRKMIKQVENTMIGRSKIIKINFKKVSVEKLKEEFATVIFTPDSLSIIKQGPAERRNFIDSILITVQRSAIPVIGNYNRCLKMRNRILTDFLAGRIQRREALQIMESLEPQFLNLASKLTWVRMEVLKVINNRAKNLIKALFNNEDVDISVDYVISDESVIDWSQNQVYDALKSRLSDLHDAEWASGQSLVGPHKHDILINLNKKNLRFFGSQGQQRAVVLAFKLAQVNYHFEQHNEYPVLLLDDVFSELDAEKRHCLISELSQIPAQIFITATELDEQMSISNKDRNIFEVVKGKVSSGWK